MTFSGDGALAFSLRPIGNTKFGSVQPYGEKDNGDVLGVTRMLWICKTSYILSKCSFW